MRSGAWSSGWRSRPTPAIRQRFDAAYRAQCRDPARLQAIWEDYRAGASSDREPDDADRGQRTISCPVLALWGADGALPHVYEDPLALWRTLAPDVEGRAIDGAGHVLVEDAPAEVTELLVAFFAGERLPQRTSVARGHEIAFVWLQSSSAAGVRASLQSASFWQPFPRIGHDARF